MPGEPQSPHTPQQATELKRFISQDERVVLGEIDRLGIQPSQREQELWQGVQFQPLSIENMPQGIDPVEESARRVFQALDLMKQSENPHLREAVTHLQALNMSGDLSFQPFPNLPRSELGVLMVEHDVVDGKFHSHIGINVREILRAPGITIALQLAHEVEHLRNALSYQETLPPGHTPEQRIAEAKRIDRKSPEYLAEEGRGNAKESEAFIYQQGLLRWPHQNSTLIKDAAEFIRAKGDPMHPKWLKYVKKKYRL